MLRFLAVLFITLLFSPLSFANAHFADRHEVKKFIQKMVSKHGFKKAELINIFNHVKVRHEVMHQIKKPMEKGTWKAYRSIFITPSHIAQGVAFWDKYHSALQRAEQTYGVPAAIIVATIGVETKYGKNKGEYPVIDALSNIAFSGSSRAKYFQSELEEFLLLTREQHLNPLKVMGSYAGAMGQPQFMPSSYRYYAVNFSHSGKIDLNHNQVDVIGSVANYYKEHGWTTDGLIAMPAAFNISQFDYVTRKETLNKRLTLAQLASYGITPVNPVSDTNLKAKLIALQSKHSQEYWLAFHNFDVIKRYNPSDLYAMALFQLGTYISAERKKQIHG